VTAARVAVLTPGGRGAIASLVVSGGVELIDHHRLFKAANGRRLAEQDPGRISYGFWGGDSNALPNEQVVVCRTGESRVELHCHGGPAAVQRILGDLVGSGAIRCDWADLAVAPSGSPASRIEVELAEALAAATTWQVAEILLDQQAGVLVSTLERLAATGWDQRHQAAACVAGLLEWSDLGRRLVDPPTVVLSGRPNVGKSSLLNALLGFGRAIVWDQPGTTRDVVTGRTALEGWPVRLADTAGLRATEDEIEAVGVEHARRELDTADLVVLVVDRSHPLDGQARQLVHEWTDAVVVANKCDLDDATDGVLPDGALMVSALTGEGLDELAGAIVARLVPGVPKPGTAVPVSERLIGCLEEVSRAIDAGDETGFRSALAETIA
jgi:tRNA modification GTPase